MPKPALCPPKRKPRGGKRPVMPALRGYCPLPDGNWALVRELDRQDLAPLGSMLVRWQANPHDFAGSLDHR